MKNTGCKHLNAAVKWLCYAQDRCADGGVSGWYSWFRGWSPSYPETTGYIIPTFYEFSDRAEEGNEYRDRAGRMADWLLSCQLETGAFPGHHVGVQAEPRIFNTGQILFGLIRAFKETDEEKYLNAAVAAADFLVHAQEEDGSWQKYSYEGMPHAYHSRVAWALLKLSSLVKSDWYQQCAVRNLDWVLRQRQPNGWFLQNGFHKDQRPYTHTLAYLVRGLFESGLILGHSKYLHPAIEVAERLLKVYEIKKCLPGEFGNDWRGDFQYSCLTGDAQISIIWQKIYRETGDARFLNAALKINDYLKSKQILNSPFRSLQGGLQGSSPIWGGYHPFWMPNWAPKFFADALMLEHDIMSELEVAAA